MPHVIDGALLYFVYRLYTVYNSVYVHKLVPLSGYYTYMITTIDQCTLDSGGERLIKALPKVQVVDKDLT